MRSLLHAQLKYKVMYKWVDTEFTVGPAEG